MVACIWTPSTILVARTGRHRRPYTRWMPRQRPKRQRTEETSASQASSSGNGPIGILAGDGTRAYVEGYSNTPTAFQLGGNVNLAGSFDHAPVPGGSYTYIKRLVSGTTQPPVETMAAEASATVCHASVGYSPLAAGKECACGFAAFAWQHTCPRCNSSLDK